MTERLHRLGLRQGSWSFADQGVVSLGNFLTHILLARILSPTEYGVFALIFGVLLFLNSIHASLVTYPLSVKGAPTNKGVLRRQASVCLLLTVLLALALSGPLLGAAWILNRLELSLWAVAAMFLWQLQEVLRRALMAHLRHRDAVWGDALSYLGRVGLIWSLSRGGQLSLERVFGIMALSFGAAAVVQVFQLGPSKVGLEEVRPFARVGWDLGRWVLLSNIVSILTIQAFPWTLAFFHGLAAAAAFQAAANLLGATHPVMFGVSNVMVPAAARARQNGSLGTSRGIAFKYAAQGAILILPYYLALALWPRGVLQVLYGVGSIYSGLETALRLFVLAYTFNYLAQALAGLLYGLEHARSVLLTQLLGALAAVIVGLPLAAWIGVPGACLGSLVVSLVRTGVGAFFVMNLREPLPEAAYL